MSVALTVIIPSVCNDDRRSSLLRAIDSSHRSGQPGQVSVLVVANGPHVSEKVLDEVTLIEGTQILQRTEGSLPKALLAGVRAVATPYFAFLDDDDQLLPDACSSRIAALENDRRADLAVINGWRQLGDERRVMVPRLGSVANDPLRALLEGNWLASCAAVFRTEQVGSEFFEDPQPYAEWTWLAYRLSLAGKRVAVVDQPGYVIHDTPGSLSKSIHHPRAYLELFKRMLQHRPPEWARVRLEAKRSAAHHDLAGIALSDGRFVAAWRHHLQSLTPLRHGWRYLAYTRKLLTNVRPQNTGERPHEVRP